MIKIMEKELKYLGEQELYNDYMTELIQIADKELNKRQLEIGSALMTGIDCFGFGVMIGKKIEREKYKNMRISNAERIERQNELLLKYEKLIANIKSTLGGASRCSNLLRK